MFQNFIQNYYLKLVRIKLRKNNKNEDRPKKYSSKSLILKSRKNNLYKFFLVFLPLCGFWLIGNATYIHAKAVFAQVLLETAWTETLHGHKEVKPWPWADTWPIARLSAPDLGISRIVLAGASGSSLAFGPGHLFGSAAPGEKGNIIISGHRDTHFSFLNQLKTGDDLQLQSEINTMSYKVTDMFVLDKTKTDVIPTDMQNKLLLVTCYPFHAITTGGPLRYVVIAEPLNPITLS